MKLSIVDRWRNVTKDALIPELATIDDVIPILDGLITHMPGQSLTHGQVAFLCDKEFAELAKAEFATRYPVTDGGFPKDLGSYNGVPFEVQ